jgi:Family of unknown function (DUF6081)
VRSLDDTTVPCQSRRAESSFDAVPGQQLVCESTVAGQIFGTAPNPFRTAVRDPSDDLRVASVAMNVIDFDTFMVLDVFFTNQRIYAF